MKNEISRQSYILHSDWDNRMQVVVNTSDGNKHVFNFINYKDQAHSHIIYDSTGNKLSNRNYSNSSEENYNHDYFGQLADYHDAKKVTSFPYKFEQKNIFTMDSLDKKQLMMLKEYLMQFSHTDEISKSR